MMGMASPIKITSFFIDLRRVNPINRYNNPHVPLNSYAMRSHRKLLRSRLDSFPQPA